MLRRHIALMALATSFIAAPAPTWAADQAEELVEQILTSEDKTVRASLVQRALKLESKEQAKLVRRIADKLTQKHAVRLLPLLERLDSPSSSELIQRLAAQPTDGPFQASAAAKALDVLRRLPLARACAGLLDNALLPDQAVADPHMRALSQFLAEGREEDGHRATVLAFAKAVVRRGDRLRQKQDPEGKARFSRYARQVPALVATAFERTNDPELLLRTLGERAGSPELKLGLLQGIPRRLKQQQRPIQLRRALEENRRAKLSESEREALPDLEEWLRSEISRDRRLSRLQRVVERERELYRTVLAQICDTAIEPALLRQALDTVPLFSEELTSEWAPVLFSLLDAEDQQLRRQSFRLLKQLSGQTLPNNRLAWERWWKTTQATEEQR